MRALILCATPRSGSTLLCDLLRATGVAGRPESWFRPGSVAGFARDWGVDPEGAGYLDAARRAGTAAGGTFGLRMMRDAMAPLQARLAARHPDLDEAGRIKAAFGPPLYLLLSREDAVAQAVSRLRAEGSGLWHRAADGTVREQVGPERQAVYDRAAIAAYMAEAAGDTAGWLGWFARHGIRPLPVSYEALCEDAPGVLSGILAALGADPAQAAAARPRSARLADETSARWAARFRAGD